MNLDQTPMKYVPCGKTTLEKQGTTTVPIHGVSDKRMITATFTITLDGQFLPMQLIYSGKTERSIPKAKFPRGFSLSANPKHFSNEKESIKLLEEIIIPYVKAERGKLGLEQTRPALLILDVFRGQTTSAVTELLHENNILVTKVPANMTNLYQPLDLTVNGYAKSFLKRKFTEWYASKIKNALDDGKDPENIDVPLQLTILKPLHASWIIQMTSEEGSRVILKGWEKSGISDGVKMGLSNLPPLDPFQQIFPLDSLPNLTCQPIAPPIDRWHEGRTVYESDESGSEWEEEGSEIRNFLDAFDNEDLFLEFLIFPQTRNFVLAKCVLFCRSRN